MVDLKSIGANIRKYRKQLGYTQERLAEKINISTVHMSHIETGAVTMSLDCLLALCGELNVTPDMVLLGSYQLDSNSTLALLSHHISALTSDEQKLLIDFAELLNKNKINR